MNTSAIEALLEKMIDLQEELINRIERLEHVIEHKLDSAIDKLDDVEVSIKEVSGELNWWGESASFAKQLLDGVEAIETSVRDISAS
jgi:hypothetical protein